uniref:P-type ATPase A domain-containing protein n=1 Tax=Tetradesmus obliquus TaxID=3088 RepID=A0A383V263_TETOB|eukprot:jgi/Sobl393_1/9555/SZX59658.1
MSSNSSSSILGVTQQSMQQRAAPPGITPTTPTAPKYMAAAAAAVAERRAAAVEVPIHTAMGTATVTVIVMPVMLTRTAMLDTATQDTATATATTIITTMGVTAMHMVTITTTTPQKQGLLQAATAAALSKAALGVTYLFSGVPQLAETVGAAAAGKVDTHVLMSLSVIGTLYMGMAQEGALLLLLFRVSHLLEDRLTERAAGSLQRLFDSVPDTASMVEVDDGGAPRVATTQQVPAESVALGQHVLVRPGEQVPLDGTITWGTANLSLQHISGEAAPVRLGPGQEVPAGSLSTDGLLVVRVEATAENSTPSRIAQMAADAQAQRPQLSRWLDRVGEVWSKAVIGATLATAALLPLLGVPFLGDRGALYRAMGVLTAGSPCALALVPLAYACAIAAITSKGILIKSGAALDALAACKTIALDKTGTITTGSMNLAEGFVFNLKPEGSAAAAVGGSSSSSSSSKGSGWIHVRAMEGLTEICKKMTGGSAAIGTTTGYSSSSFESSFDDDDYEHRRHASSSSSSSSSSSQPPAAAAALGAPLGGVPFDELALKCAVALSRLSNHPVSRAMVDSAPHVDGDVAVLSFEQVPGSGVQGVCRIGEFEPVHVRFGAADWINSFVTSDRTVSQLDVLMKQHTDRPSRATALLSVSQLLPTQQQQPDPAAVQQQQQQQQQESLPPLPELEQPDMAVILDGAANPSGSSSSSSSSSSSRPVSSSSSSSSSSRRPGAVLSRPSSPARFLGSMDNRDGSTTFAFEEEEAFKHAMTAATAAAAPASHTSSIEQQQQQQSPGSSVSGSVDVDGSYGPSGQPSHMALLCFEDVIQAGVPATVQQLQSGSWSSSRWRGSGSWLLGSSPAAAEKDVVMLTGDNQRVAQAVAGAVGISQYRAGLKPEDKLAYVTNAAAAAAAAAGPGQRGTGAGGLLMAGDGINDAPALAAAQVGVAIASTPKDMVAAAADIIVLNGQGITSLPWLFRLADRTHVILQQNLALALASVAVATLPTVAGLFPLWLAVTLHEGSTLLVALNSLRLLLEAPHSSDSSSSGAKGAAAAGHGHKHSSDKAHSH